MADEPKRAKIRGKATKGKGSPKISAADIKKANETFDRKYAKKYPFLKKLLDAEVDEEAGA